MKKKSLWAIIALAGLTISSCTNDEVIPNTSVDNAIEFGTYLGRDAQTRGSVLNNDVSTGLSHQGFGVFAYYTDNGDFKQEESPLNYMKNTMVTSPNGTDWTYSPVKYWPNEATDKLSFFAYAPYNSTYSPTTTGDPILEFTVAREVTNQIDLVVADATNLKNLTKQSVTDKVLFNFKHVLSRVGFKVEAVIDQTNEADGTNPDTDSQTNGIAEGTVISVQEVELIGDFNTAAKINLNSSAWSNGTTATTSYSLGTDGFTDAAKAVAVTKAQLNKASEYMMLIPVETYIKIRVKYTVTTTDYSLTDGKSEVVNDITSAEIPFTFAQGKAYDFVLHLGLTSVKLSANVTNWDTEEDIVVNVPMNNN